MPYMAYMVSSIMISLSSDKQKCLVEFHLPKDSVVLLGRYHLGHSYDNNHYDFSIWWLLSRILIQRVFDQKEFSQASI